MIVVFIILTQACISKHGCAFHYFDPPVQKMHYVSLTKTLASEMAGEWRLGVVVLEVDGCAS